MWWQDMQSNDKCGVLIMWGLFAAVMVVAVCVTIVKVVDILYWPVKVIQ